MKVSDAVKNRKSIRAFTDKSVDSELLKTILSISSRSPSGGNLQPWKIFVLNNQSMKKFKTFQKKWTEPESAAYDIYPKNLKEPYLSHSKKVGEQLYGSIGIARDDKEARWNQMFKNFEFFGAPAGLFCFVDRQMGLPQWSDLGMFGFVLEGFVFQVFSFVHRKNHAINYQIHFPLKCICTVRVISFGIVIRGLPKLNRGKLV